MPSLIATGTIPKRSVAIPMSPTPSTLPKSSGRGGTIASSTSLIRFAFSIATPFATEIVSPKSNR